MTENYCKPGGTPKWVYDATTNDSDKSFTVPTGKRWDMREVHAELTATATVGNRQLAVIITDGTNTIMTAIKTSNVAATQTGVTNLYFGNGPSNNTTNTNNPLLSTGTPTVGYGMTVSNTMLLAGYVIRAYDFNAVDAAADDLTVVLHYIEYDV